MVTTTDLEEIGVIPTHTADRATDYNNSAKPLIFEISLTYTNTLRGFGVLGFWGFG